MKRSYSFLLQWLIIAFIAGLIGSIIIRIFLSFYDYCTEFLLSLYRVPVVIWPAAGAAVTSLIIYRLEPRSKGEGIPSYILGLRESGGELSISETFFKFFAAALTLGTFGNGGFLGPVGRVSAGIMSALRRITPKKLIAEEQTLLFPVCGLAAAFGALVHSPVGAGIFAVEIIQKSSMRYRQLFPAVLASTVSVYFSKLFGFQPVFRINAAAEAFDLKIAGLLLLLSLFAGFTGRGFTMLYGLISKLFHRDIRDRGMSTVARTVLGSISAFYIVYLVNPVMIGTSSGIFDALLHGGEALLYGNLDHRLPLVLVILLLIPLKALANSLTVGSGMSAGFAGPAMLIGLLAGAAFAAVFGIAAGSAEYYALLAAGFAAVFSSTMNTPFAVAVLTIELFGMHYSMPAAAAAIIGFQVNRHNTLYDMVFEEESDY